MTKHKDEYRNGGHNGPATVNFHNEEVPPTRALIVHLSLRNAVSENFDQQRTVDADLAEITGLALAIELEIVETSIVSLRQVSPATYLGTGKVNEIEQLVATDDIELVRSEERRVGKEC